MFKKKKKVESKFEYGIHDYGKCQHEDPESVWEFLKPI